MLFKSKRFTRQNNNVTALTGLVIYRQRQCAWKPSTVKYSTTGNRPLSVDC